MEGEHCDPTTACDTGRSFNGFLAPPCQELSKQGQASALRPHRKEDRLPPLRVASQPRKELSLSRSSRFATTAQSRRHAHEHVGEVAAEVITDRVPCKGTFIG